MQEIDVNVMLVVFLDTSLHDLISNTKSRLYNRLKI